MYSHETFALGLLLESLRERKWWGKIKEKKK